MVGRRGTGRARRRGITRIEIIALLVVLAVVAAIVIPALDRARRNEADLLRTGAVREQMRAFLAWAEVNNGQFPLPSALDLTDATVAAKGGAKNTSANIVSILIWCNLTTPERQVDKHESGNIEVDEDYQHTNPRNAVRSGEALWDPAFSADFTGAVPGNLSWAHRVPTPWSSPRWGNSLRAAAPVVSSRGARMSGVGGTPSEPRPIWADPASRHLIKSGGRLGWEGPVGYGDGHVTYETSVFVSGMRRGDALFFDEPGSAHDGNDYLSIFTKAGEARSDFVAIWD